MRKYLYLIILCVVFAGCKGSQQKGNTAESNGKESVANSDGKPAVTVTIPPYKFFVDKIAGDKVDVNVMVSNGNNPETYEPYAQQMMELSRSALYLKVGSIGFEQTWMKKLQDNAPDMKVIDTSTGITPAKTPGGNTDPHVWMSCKNARIISSNIFKHSANWNRRTRLSSRKTISSCSAASTGRTASSERVSRIIRRWFASSSSITLSSLILPVITSWSSLPLRKKAGSLVLPS